MLNNSNQFELFIFFAHSNPYLIYNKSQHRHKTASHIANIFTCTATRAKGRAPRATRPGVPW